MASSKHIGSSFEDFLDEEGILDEVDARVQKRIFADELRGAMKERAITEAGLARAMKTSRTVVRSLLDPESESATLVTLTKAARAVGRELHISLEKERKLERQPRSVAARTAAKKRPATKAASKRRVR